MSYPCPEPNVSQENLPRKVLGHDDVIKWKHFPRYWPFVRVIHRSPVKSPQKGQWRGALMFSLICVWINSWVNNREVDDLRRYRAHYDVIVMKKKNNHIPLSSNRNINGCNKNNFGHHYWKGNFNTRMKACIKIVSYKWVTYAKKQTKNIFVLKTSKVGERRVW